MLWHAKYWDGPLSGYVLLDGEDGYWVDCIDDRWEERPDDADESCKGEGAFPGCDEYPGGGRCCMTIYDRVYLVYKLTSEQDKVEKTIHALFRKWVGTHTAYNEEGSRRAGQRDWNAENEANGDADGIPLGPGVKPRKYWNSFYKAKKPERTPCQPGQAVGWTKALFPDGTRR